MPTSELLPGPTPNRGGYVSVTVAPSLACTPQWGGERAIVLGRTCDRRPTHWL